MTTSGSTAFNLEFSELAEEAWERAGREMRSGYDLRTARRSMNLMTIEWANRGLNMWTIETGTIALTQGLNTYALPLDTIDLLDHVIRTQPNVSSTQADLSITRISVSTYATIPNKLIQGRPIQVWIQRLSGQTNPTTATLGASISATDTTVTLFQLDGLAGSGFVRIGSEDIYYTYISGNTLGGVFRGQNNTTATSHTVGDAVSVPQLPAITVWPTPDGSQPYQFVYYRLRREPQKVIKGEPVLFGQPKVVVPTGETTAEGIPVVEPFTKLIGNGSRVTVKVAVFPAGKFRGHRLESVRVDEHVPYEPNSDAQKPQTPDFPF